MNGGTPLELGTPKVTPVPGEADDDPVEALAAMEEEAQQEPTTPVDAPAEACPKPWLELTLLADDGKPLAGAAYKVDLPSFQGEGTLDDRGFVHLDDVKAMASEISVRILRDDTDPENPVYRVEIVPKESPTTMELEPAIDHELDFFDIPFDPV